MLPVITSKLGLRRRVRGDRVEPCSRFHCCTTWLPCSSTPPCSIVSPSCTQVRSIFSLVDIPSSRGLAVGAFIRVSLVFAGPRRLPPSIPTHVILPLCLSRFTRIF